ncbi:MAG: helix-turn-helix domain-containing protein [Clostridia bacterium]|nr:helix-turn-helix domain-containing protein [Clostridia bacterium]
MPNLWFQDGTRIGYFENGRVIFMERKILREPTTHHIHNYYEIEFITEGSGEYFHNGTAYPIRPGLLFYVTPTDFHQIIPRDPLTMITLIIHEQMISPEWQTFFMRQPGNNVYLLDQQETAQWNARFLTLETEIAAKDGYARENQTRLLEIMLSAVARMLSQQQKKQPKHTQFQRALDYIAHHYCEPLTLEEIAGAVGYTPQYFCSLFHRQTGRQLMDFLTDLRLNHAKMLLRTTDLSIIEICFRSGFNSQSSFFRHFRRFGQTPAAYRKELRS